MGASQIRDKSRPSGAVFVSGVLIGSPNANDEREKPPEQDGGAGEKCAKDDAGKNLRGRG